MESGDEDAQDAAVQHQPFDAPVSIRVVSYLAKAIDIDNQCIKFILDGIVKAGILQDDSPAYVESVTLQQVKVKNITEEKTVVTITEV